MMMMMMMKKKKTPSEKKSPLLLLFGACIVFLGWIRVGHGFLLMVERNHKPTAGRRIAPAIERTARLPQQEQQQRQQHDVCLSAVAVSSSMDGIWQVLSTTSPNNEQQQLLDAVSDLPLPVLAAAGGGIAAVLIVVTNVLPSLLPAPARLVDEKTMADIVRGTFLANKELTCAYKASRDGWSALDFHQAVDNRGCGVVVAKAATGGGGGGAVFGGFNPSGWRSTDDYYTSSTAFLWAKSGGAAAVAKFPILPGGNAAIFDYATSGPNFGAGDLQIGPPLGAIMGGFAGPDAEDISTSAGNLRTCKASPGMTYGGTGTKKWPVRGTVRLVEVEVYCQSKF